MESISYDFSLRTPLSACFIGVSQAGKSHLLYEIIRKRETYFRRPISRVIICYYVLNDDLMRLKEEDQNVFLVQSIQEVDSLILPQSLVILDDILHDLGSKETYNTVASYFTRGAHHKHFSVFLTLQRPFSPETRIIVNNSQLLVYFSSPRDKSFISFVAKQFCPNTRKFLPEAYRIATSEKYGYLVLDCDIRTPEFFRVRNKIIPDGNTKIFRPQ